MIWRKLQCVLCVLAVSACSDLPTREAGGESEFIERQQAAAQRAETEGRLAAALDHWHSVLVLQPENEVAGSSVARLQQVVDDQVSVALKNANSAYSAGDRGRGDTWMLKVLALRPGQEQALASLRKSSTNREQTKQSARTEKEMREMMARRRAAPDSPQTRIKNLYGQGNYKGVISAAAELNLAGDREMANLLHQSHLALADQFAANNDPSGELGQLQTALEVYPEAGSLLESRIAEVARSLSNQWMKKGTAALKTDLPGAIAAFEKAVAYDPDNRPAKLELKRARVLARNLEKIKQR